MSAAWHMRWHRELLFTSSPVYRVACEMTSRVIAYVIAGICEMSRTIVHVAPSVFTTGKQLNTFEYSRRRHDVIITETSVTYMIRVQLTWYSRSCVYLWQRRRIRSTPRTGIPTSRMVNNNQHVYKRTNGNEMLMSDEKSVRYIQASFSNWTYAFSAAPYRHGSSLCNPPPSYPITGDLCSPAWFFCLSLTNVPLAAYINTLSVQKRSVLIYYILTSNERLCIAACATVGVCWCTVCRCVYVLFIVVTEPICTSNKLYVAMQTI